MPRWLLAASLGAAIAAAAYWRKALTVDGAIAAACIGTVVFARGGVRAAISLVVFFVSSSALSRLGEHQKRQAPLAQAKGAQRDAWQVLANGGVATLAIALGRPTAFVGALAAAAADTWATELGLLARSRPRMITTLAPVPPGTSGAITPEGLVASLCGAVVVGLASNRIVTAAVAGLGGSLVDSLLGATVQATYVCERCGSPAEDAVHAPCRAPARRTTGFSWVTNDAVNAAATTAGAVIAVLF
jgi:uncharacterized protein (TIGR00297 family)